MSTEDRIGNGDDLVHRVHSDGHGGGVLATRQKPPASIYVKGHHGIVEDVEDEADERDVRKKQVWDSRRTVMHSAAVANTSL